MALDEVEQGQELNAEILVKLDQRKEAAAAMVKRKGESVHEANEIIDVRRQTAFEILEKRDYNNLDKIINVDKRSAKLYKTEQKKVDALVKQHKEKWHHNLTTVHTNVKALKLDVREKDEQYFEDWETKEKHMRAIQKEKANQV